MTYKHLPRASPGGSKTMMLPPFERPKTLDDIWKKLCQMEDDAHERWLALNTQLNKLYEGQLKQGKRLAVLERRLAK